MLVFPLYVTFPVALYTGLNFPRALPVPIPYFVLVNSIYAGRLVRILNNCIPDITRFKTKFPEGGTCKFVIFHDL